MTANAAAAMDAELGERGLRLLQIAQPWVLAGYRPDDALALLSAAKGREGETWAERRLAILLLEGQVLQMSLDDLPEFDLLLVALGLKEPGIGEPLRDSVISEGFTTLELHGFAGELMRRMGRLRRVHQCLRGDTPDWRYYFRAARDVSKLTLARYLFSAEETFREIVSVLRISEGACDAVGRQNTHAAPDAPPDAPPDCPGFERELLRLLCQERRIYWVSERCGSELNALVEYPLTSAVVVIKPPGSDLEFEIKRAGTRGGRLLNVIATRNGVEAPVSHRLFGGSLGWLAERETGAARILSKIYREVHGVECPSSMGVLNSPVVTVPNGAGETHILDYLSDAQQFGAGFDEMRAAMELCVKSFPWDTGVSPASYSGEVGATLRFIGQALPQQAILFGSSSFRLDRLAVYLSENGAVEYFETGLGCGYTPGDARWLADSVLEEILGEMDPPAEGFGDYAQYLRDAFGEPRNRARADASYLSAMGQIGEFWGTLLAVRGFSDGESFVLRNVGLKSVWKNGAWRVRVIFMDHDDLTVAGSRYSYLWPWREASGMERDRAHILGGVILGCAPGQNDLPGEAGILRTIFRVSAETADAGMKALETAAAGAYRHTQDELDSNAALRELFYPQFLAGHRDFDELVPWLLKTDAGEIESWKLEARESLKSRGYEDELAAEYAKTLAHYRPYFERMAFLYSK